MESYFLCLQKKDFDTSKEKEIISGACAPLGIKGENCLTCGNVREFFLNFSKLASQEAFAVLAVDTYFFENVKDMVFSVLSVKTAENEEIAALYKGGDENRKIHITMPENCTLFPTQDGMYSGFAFKAEKLTVAFLPLDSERTPQCIDSFRAYAETLDIVGAESEPSDNPEITEAPAAPADPFSQLCSALSQRNMKIALSVSSAGAKALESFSQCGEIDFFTSEVKRDGNSPKTYAGMLAKEAAERSPSHTGAVITRGFKLAGDEKGLFVIAAVADSEYVKLKRIYAEENEDISSLTLRAADTLFAMIAEFISSADEKPPVPSEPEYSEESKPSRGGKKFWIAAIVAIIAAAAVLFAINSVRSSIAAGGNPTENSTGYTENYTDSRNGNHGQVDLIDEDTTQDTAEEEPFTEETEETEPTEKAETYPETEEAKTTSSVQVQPVMAPKPTVTETSAPKPSASGVFVFTVYGYGHGVGMSQYGADAWAKQGWTYDKILTHYYTGTKIADDPNMPATLKVKGKDVETPLAVAMAVQGEMGPSFHPEALKAQAVAAYTYAMRSGGTCDGMYTVSTPSQAVIDAVNSVMGKYISYNGTYINAVFFSCSGGKTASSSSVWGSTVVYPYLVPVDSSPDLSLKNCKSVVRISSEDMKKRAFDSYGVNLTGDPSTWLEIKSHDNSTGTGVGYVSQISMGGKILSGNQFRTYVMDYDIRSHCFSVEFIPD